MAVTKLANPTSVPAPGASVIFTVRVDNTTGSKIRAKFGATRGSGMGGGAGAAAGPRDSGPNSAATTDLTLTGLTDTDFGDLNGQGTCAVPQTVAAGSSYTCTFSGFVGGAGGSQHVNTVTAVGNFAGPPPVAASSQADATVDVVPSVPTLAAWAQLLLLLLLGATGAFLVSRRGIHHD